MARKYQHTPEYLRKKGIINQDTYEVLTKKVPKARKKYDVSNRIGKSRGAYTGWSTFKKMLKQGAVKSDYKMPTRQEYEIAYRTQRATKLQSGLLPTHQEAIQLIVSEAFMTQKQADAIAANLMVDISSAITILKNGLRNEETGEQEWADMSLGEILMVIESIDAISDYQKDLLRAIISLCTNSSEFWNFIITASDIRANTRKWQVLQNVIDQQDEWDDIYGS